MWRIRLASQSGMFWLKGSYPPSYIARIQGIPPLAKRTLTTYRFELYRVQRCFSRITCCAVISNTLMLHHSYPGSMYWYAWRWYAWRHVCMFYTVRVGGLRLQLPVATCLSIDLLPPEVINVVRCSPLRQVLDRVHPVPSQGGQGHVRAIVILPVHVSICTTVPHPYVACYLPFPCVHFIYVIKLL